jgi:hypothetical protein
LKEQEIGRIMKGTHRTVIPEDPSLLAGPEDIQRAVRILAFAVGSGCKES